MHTHDISCYLKELDVQRKKLAQVLNKKGVKASEDEKLNTLVAKVNDIENDYEDITYILEEIARIQNEMKLKVDKEEGKGLSTNDYTDEDKDKLSQTTICKSMTEEQIDKILDW